MDCPPGLCERQARGSRPLWRERRAGFLAGLLCAAVVGAAAALLPAERLAHAALSAAVAAEAPARPRAELPREWRWERKAITFDHMFRER
jgi:hypothetical protein